MTIRKFHKNNKQENRNVCLIPDSAHGTNPASAQMCGMKVVVVNCDDDGNVDIDDLKNKAEKYSKDLAALMVTYPSTHGVFEEKIIEICDVIHKHGGQVYMDGANLNALVGIANQENLDLMFAILIYIKHSAYLTVVADQEWVRLLALSI